MKNFVILYVNVWTITVRILSGKPLGLIIFHGGKNRCRILRVLRRELSLHRQRLSETKCSAHSSRLISRSIRLLSQLKTDIKKYQAALTAGDQAAAQAAYRAAVKKIDQAAARGIIHKNAAARKKSQFTKAINNM